MALLAAFGVGLIVGSFLNVVIYRLPREQSVVLPRSRCPVCLAPIAWHDNIPVLSYLVLRGKCRHCGARISPTYPLIEVLTGLAAAAAVWRFGLSPTMLLNAGFYCALIALIFIDLYHRILPDVITLPLALAGAAFSYFQSPAIFYPAMPGTGQTSTGRWADHLLASLLGMALGAGSLWLVARVYYKLRKIEGLGQGDIKLMAAVGAFLGWSLAALTIFLGSLLGAFIGSAYMFYRGKDFQYELPFGTFLGAAAIAAALWGPMMIRWYTSFYS
jgi:leader peptidase (prepilin peptidase)/N-methyltransferase